MHQPVQPARDAREHAHREARIAADLAEHRVLADAQHQRVAQRLRVDDVGLAGEHQRLGEALARADELDHLLLSGRRDREQLDLAGHRDMELLAGLADPEHRVAALQPAQPAALGQAQQLGRRHLLEQRQHGEVAGQVEGACREIHGVRSADEERGRRELSGPFPVFNLTQVNPDPDPLHRTSSPCAACCQRSVACRLSLAGLDEVLLPGLGWCRSARRDVLEPVQGRRGCPPPVALSGLSSSASRPQAASARLQRLTSAAWICASRCTSSCGRCTRA